MLSLHPARRRAVALVIIAVLITVSAIVPTWCAVSGLWR